MEFVEGRGPKDRPVRFWWRYASRFRSRVPES